MFETLLLAGILAAGFLVLLRLINQKSKTRVPPKSVRQRASRPKIVKSTASGQFKAVSCKGGCAAIKSLQGKRFLEREAPGLPVPGCVASRCSCIYAHHDDRRGGKEDRRALSQISREFFGYSGKPNRRNRRGRRESDFAMA